MEHFPQKKGLRFGLEDATNKGLWSALRETVELRSHGTAPGIIQLPPGGQPIIEMSGAQTAGGYPKLATIIEADLWRVGQAPLGSLLRFVETMHAAAVAAEEHVRRYIDGVRAAALAKRGNDS